MDAVMFPGQGSQKPGMGVPWSGSPSWAAVGVISDVIGRDVGSLLVDADADVLRATRNAQIAAFALGAVILDAARRAGMTWGAAIGHSLGEYTALLAAGALQLEEAAWLVGERAEAMQRATETAPGTMVAVLGLDAEAVEACCRSAGDGVWVANDNAPGQIVVAGTVEAVGAAADAARAQGGKVLPLAVGGAFHTPLMATAQERLDLALGKSPFCDAGAVVVTNVDATSHQTARELRSALSAQLCRPVRWRESVLELQRRGVTRAVELGPGGVLGGMVKRIAPGMERRSVSAPDDLP